MQIIFHSSQNLIVYMFEYICIGYLQFDKQVCLVAGHPRGGSVNSPYSPYPDSGFLDCKKIEPAKKFLPGKIAENVVLAKVA